MKNNRSDLDPFGFVLPVEAESHRAQIPGTFFKFTGASSPVRIPQKNGRNVEITGGDLIAVYSVMRNKPPSHRWKGGTVSAELAKQGIGENKVRATLKFLNDEGWIRYIDLPKFSGKHAGTIIEVQYRRLPRSEAGKKRHIRIEPDGKLRMFENDGTVVEDARSRRIFLVPDRDPERPYGRDDDEVDWKPYTLPSGTRLPVKREPLERPPCKEYKDHLDKDHSVKDLPFYPQAEPGEPESSFIKIREENDEEDFEASEVYPPASSPGKIDFQIGELVDKLVKLGKEASKDPTAQAQYEEFVLSGVVPRLADPPLPPRWTVPAARKWFEQSLKAQVLLAFCSDSHWPDVLLRSFGKHCGMYSAEDLENVLLGYDWNAQGKMTLEKLIRNGQREWNLSGWRSFTSKMASASCWTREDVVFAVESFELLEGETDLDVATDWIKSANRDTEPFLRGDPDCGDVFDWLYAIFRNGTCETAISIAGPYDEIKRKFRDPLMDFVSRSRQHLSVASYFRDEAEQIWGIDWVRVRGIHQVKIERLNRRARNYGIPGVEPLFDLIDRPLRGLPPVSSGESAQSDADEAKSLEEDICSPAQFPPNVHPSHLTFLIDRTPRENPLIARIMEEWRTQRSEHW